MGSTIKANLRDLCDEKIKKKSFVFYLHGDRPFSASFH